MNLNHPRAETIPLAIKLDIISGNIKGSRVMNQYYKRITDHRIKWSNYLSKVDYIQKNGIEAAIRKYLTYTDPVTGKQINYFLNRFYKGVPKGELESEIRKVFQDWIDRGYPMPKLPPYAQSLLPTHR